MPKNIIKEISHPALRLVKEVFETTDAEEAAAKLFTGEWIAFAAFPDNREGTNWKFCLGRVI